MRSHFLRTASGPSSNFWTFVTSTTAASGTIVVPSSSIEGDLLVLLDAPLYTTGTSPPASSIPADFSLIATSNLGNVRVSSSYCLTTTSKASVTLTGMTGTSSNTKILLVFRPKIKASSVSLQDVGQEATAGDPVSQTITSGSSTKQLISFGFYRNNISGSVRSFTPTEDGGVTLSNATIKYKIYNANQDNVTVDLNDTGAINILQSCYIEMN